MNYELSCGAVVFTRKNDEIFYVIVKSIEGFYGFPKGHMEKNETEKETALREILEEVGLEVKIDEGCRIVAEHPLPKKKGVMKRIIYFVAEYENQIIKYQQEELQDARLMKYEEAISSFQFEESKNILKEANEYILKNYM